MSKTTDGPKRTTYNQRQTAISQEQARIDAQNLILEENKAMAEVNARQAEALRVAQLARTVRAGGDLSPSQVAELQAANTPQAIKTLKRSGHFHDPAGDLAKGAAGATVGAVAAATLGPVVVPVLAAGKVLERVFKPNE